MILNNEGLVSFCKDMLHKKTAYCWGAFGQKITSSFVEGRRKQYPTRYSDKRVQYLNSLQGYIGCDCVGMIKAYYWQGKYNPKTDVNCTGMLNLAKKKGLINTLPEIPGLILYKPGHVGVYIGGGEAIECTLSTYGDGVVQSKAKGRGWTHWLQCPFIASTDDTLREKIQDKLDNNIKIPEPAATDDNRKLPHGRPSLLKKILRFIK